MAAAMTPVLPDPNGSTGRSPGQRAASPAAGGLRVLADKVLPLPEAARTGALLFAEGASVGLFLWASLATSVLPYSLENDLSAPGRKLLLASLLGCGAAALLLGLAFLARARQAANKRLELAAVRLSPLLFVGLPPFLFRYQIWATRELTYGVFACALGFACGHRFKPGRWPGAALSRRLGAL